jgi:hypothetical protein
VLNEFFEGKNHLVSEISMVNRSDCAHQFIRVVPWRQVSEELESDAAYVDPRAIRGIRSAHEEDAEARRRLEEFRGALMQGQGKGKGQEGPTPEVKLHSLLGAKPRR